MAITALFSKPSLMSSKLFTTINMGVTYSRQHLVIPCRNNAAVKDTFIIQSASTQEDYKFVSKIIKEEQWSATGLHMITHVGPSIKPGYFIGYLNGQRIGSISACKYGEGNDSLFFCGSHAVTEPFRGKGYGSQLSRTLVNLGKECNMGCDSHLMDIVSVNERIFGHTSDYKSVYRQYVLPCSRLQLILKEEASSAKGVTRIKPIDKFDFSKLLTYDASVFGFLREAFLRAWITIPESMGLVATNNKGDITGYAVMQPSLFDVKEEQIIGPLYSDNEHVAQLLLYTLAKAAIDKKGSSMLRLTVPVEAANPSVAELIEKEIGCTAFIDSIHMFAKGFPPHAYDKIIAVTSPSLE